MPAGVVRVKGVLAFDEDRLTRYVRPTRLGAGVCEMAFITSRHEVSNENRIWSSHCLRPSRSVVHYWSGFRDRLSVSFLSVQMTVAKKFLAHVRNLDRTVFNMSGRRRVSFEDDGKWEGPMSLYLVVIGVGLDKGQVVAALEGIRVSTPGPRCDPFLRANRSMYQPN